MSGYARDIAGNPEVQLIFAGVAIAIAVLALIGFRVIQIRKENSTALAL